MKNSFIFLIIVLLISCNSKISEEQNAATIKVLKQLAPSTDFSQRRYILVIPFGGCLSCFHEAIQLIPLVKQKQGIVIMPNIHKRVVTNTLEDMNIDREKVIIDTLQLTTKNNIVSTDPMLFIIDHNKVIRSEDVEFSTCQKILESK
ncbi:hypothetical protein EYV94_20470 [Puteibacter caeruleilacunae]|nr:hypothetical protein EYV94_20470 [Puteibacter caeruleilacunae]